MILLALPGAAVGDIGREEARRAAREELARREYRSAEPPWPVRVLEWVAEWFAERLDGLSAVAPGGRAGIVVVIALLALLLAVVLVRLAPARRARGSAAVFSAGSALTADDHRQRADQAAAEGAWAEAVRERLRAVVRELEARGVLDSRPGRTADEVARDAGEAVPSLALDLARAARTFDEVWYGGRTADASAYDVLVEVDGKVSSGRLVRT